MLETTQAGREELLQEGILGLHPYLLQVFLLNG